MNPWDALSWILVALVAFLVALFIGGTIWVICKQVASNARLRRKAKEAREEREARNTYKEKGRGSIR